MLQYTPYGEYTVRSSLRSVSASVAATVARQIQRVKLKSRLSCVDGVVLRVKPTDYTSKADYPPVSI